MEIYKRQKAICHLFGHIQINAVKEAITLTDKIIVENSFLDSRLFS